MGPIANRMAVELLVKIRKRTEERKKKWNQNKEENR